MAYTPTRWFKAGHDERIAETAAEAVQLRFDGWGLIGEDLPPVKFIRVARLIGDQPRPANLPADTLVLRVPEPPAGES